MAYDDILANLAEVDDEQLNTAHTEITGRINALRPKIADRSLTPDELAELQGTGDTPGLRQIYDDVSTQVGERQAKRDEAYAALDQTMANVPDPDAEGGEGGEGEAQPEGEQPAEQEQPADSETTGQEAAPNTDTQATQAAESTQGQPVAAAASNPPMGAIGRQNNNGNGSNGSQTPPTIRPAIAITASSGDATAWDNVGNLFSDRLRKLAKAPHADGEQVSVVTLTASGVPEDRYLRRNAGVQNTAKLDAATGPTAITAAGGLCAPLAIDYSYDVIGVTGRPIRDALPGFQAERGGIQYRPHLSPATNTATDGPRSATGHWTMADDEAAEDPDDDGRKAFWIVDCPDTMTAEVEAITLQLEFSNVTSRFDPETVQANQQAALIWHDRHAENWLLGKLQAASKILTSAQVLGAVCDFLVTFDRAQAYYRSVHRLGDNVQLRGVMPFWTKHLVRADMARRMALNPTETLAITDAQVDSWFATRNITPVWHLDGADANVAAVTGPPAIPAIPAQQYTLAAQGAAVPKHPAMVDMLLHTENHFQHLEGGTLDLGIVRDSELIGRNRYREFTETWEGVAARGVEALRLLANVAPTGETAGAVDVAPTA